MDIIMGYLLIVNVLAFIIYGFDKYQARKAGRRIPEATLLIWAGIGGSIGAWMGMKLWHHKTLHKKFKYGIPILITMQVTFVVYMYTNYFV
ncbi:MAG: DUF1294 domain-containing protein [Parabacteroides sp.]|nr:DUF1294 domain-containing protein [Parabacteroides sp.]